MVGRMLDIVIPSPSVVMGSNVRRLRGEHTTDELARAATAWGLRGGTGRIAEVEGGRVSPTVPTVYMLVLALKDLLGRDVSPAELFEGRGKVAMPGGDIELHMLRSMLSDQPPQRPKPNTSEITDWIKDMQATWPKRLMDLPAARIHQTSAEMREADLRVGKSFGLDTYRTAAEMAYLWGKPLSAVRDEQAGPNAKAQRRGQISRQLKAELEKIVRNGDDR